MTSVEPFPWHEIPRTTRQAEVALAGVRGRVQTLSAGSVGQHASELLAAEVSISLATPRVAERFASRGSDLFFSLGDEPNAFVVSVDPELVSRVVSRLLDRSPPLAGPGNAADPALLGGFAAVLTEIARRDRLSQPLMWRPARGLGSPLIVLDGVARVDGAAFSWSIWCEGGGVVPSRRLRSTTCPVSLPVVVATSTVRRTELAQLEVGAAWLPEAFFPEQLDPLVGTAYVAGPGAEVGIAMEFSTAGTMTMGRGLSSLLADVSDDLNEAEPTASDASDPSGALKSAVLEAPVVVRVEMGAVSMSAGDWMALAPGDVIETGTRVNGPVVLRVAGREVARGELVQIDGRVGVRVMEISSGGPA